MTRAQQAAATLERLCQASTPAELAIVTERSYAATGGTRFLLRNYASGERTFITRAQGIEEIVAIAQALLETLAQLRAQKASAN